MKTKVKNYYSEIDEALKSWENNIEKSWHDKSMEWVSNRICWCWKFRKISKVQMEELADRATNVFKRQTNLIRKSKQENKNEFGK